MFIARKRKKVWCLVLALAIVLGSFVSIENASADTNTSLKSKSVYSITGYKNNDCVLTANVYMLRRAAILEDSRDWSKITNSKLRAYACTSVYGSSLKYSYTYSFDGLEFDVSHGYLTGSASQKKSQIKKLLKAHPEGIVVRGQSTSGGHGILLTGYDGDVIYAVDSAQNLKGSITGVTTFGKTTMTGIGSLTHYWYVEGVSGESKSNVDETEVQNLKVVQEDGQLKLTWELSREVDLDGYVIYIKEDGEFKKIGTSTKKSFVLEGQDEGTTEKYRVRGYRKIDGKKIYTISDFVTFDMDDDSADSTNGSAYENADDNTESSESVNDDIIMTITE